MISIRKPKLVLQCLKNAETVRQNNEGDQARKDFPWNKAEVRGALIAQQGAVCAYCNNVLDLTSMSTQVDHYRPQRSDPKSDTHHGYPWLSCDWGNLLLVCEHCNKLKSSKFELLDEAARANDVHRDHACEQPKILNPCVDDVEGLFQVELLEDYPFHEIRSSNNHASAEVADYMADLFQFSTTGRIELYKARQEYLFEFTQNMGDEYLWGSKPFAWMGRQIKGFKPDPVSDVLTCVEVLLTKLAEIDKLVDHYGGKWPNDYAKRLYWALAVYLFEHPHKEEIKAYMESRISNRTRKVVGRYLKTLDKSNPAAGSDDSGVVAP